MAVEERWFGFGTAGKTSLFEMSRAEKWADFDTLAAAVVAERKRLDSIKGE